MRYTLIFLFLSIVFSCKKDEPINPESKYQNPSVIFSLCGTQDSTTVLLTYTLMDTSKTDTIKHWSKSIVYASAFDCSTPLYSVLSVDGLPESGFYYQEAKATCLNCNPYPLSSYSYTGEIIISTENFNGIANADIVGKYGVRIQ